MSEQGGESDVARREVEDLWWLRHCLEALIATKDVNSMIRVGLLRGVLETTRPETSTTDPATNPHRADLGGDEALGPDEIALQYHPDDD